MPNNSIYFKLAARDEWNISLMFVRSEISKRYPAVKLDDIVYKRRERVNIEDYKEYNRRKEERFEIGLDEQRIKAINFKDAEHKLIINKKQLPCVINNISYSGAKITTEEENFEVNKRIGLCLSFINPIEQVFLIGTIRNCFIKTIKFKEHPEPIKDFSFL